MPPLACKIKRLSSSRMIDEGGKPWTEELGNWRSRLADFLNSQPYFSSSGRPETFPVLLEVWQQTETTLWGWTLLTVIDCNNQPPPWCPVTIEIVGDNAQGDLEAVLQYIRLSSAKAKVSTELNHEANLRLHWRRIGGPHTRGRHLGWKVTIRAN